MEYQIIDRDVSPKELEQIKRGFDLNTKDNAIEVQTSDRFGFVATNHNRFVGCSSGLAYKNGNEYSGWFYLTDLFVEKEYRGLGIGASLLKSLENKIVDLGVKNIWTWTAGYEAPNFYIKQGYEIFTELEDWYSDGSSRMALRKSFVDKPLVA